jgi:hypothetical protein
MSFYPSLLWATYGANVFWSITVVSTTYIYTVLRIYTELRIYTQHYVCTQHNVYIHSTPYLYTKHYVSPHRTKYTQQYVHTVHYVHTQYYVCTQYNVYTHSTPYLYTQHYVPPHRTLLIFLHSTLKCSKPGELFQVRWVLLAMQTHKNHQFSASAVELAFLRRERRLRCNDEAYSIL